MGKSQWGPPIWNLLHTLAEKVKEDRFEVMGPQIISQIIQICHILPCPECTQHAKIFWSRTKLGTIKTKTDLKKVTLPDVNVDDLAYLQYSSGSTRFPHGVAVTHKSLMSNCYGIGKIAIKSDIFPTYLPES